MKTASTNKKKPPQKIQWEPTPKQHSALIRPEFEIAYGGARGGGKTDAGMAWKTYDLSHPKFKGLVLRKNADDLSDWISRAKNMYRPLDVTFSGNPPIITHPRGGFIKTGHIKDKDAYSKYVGHEYHRILFEELNLVPSEELYLKVISSCRSTVPELRPQVFSTFNPGNAGHNWIKRRFGLEGIPNKPILKTDQITGRDRIFIPARVDDNPYLMENDPDYVKFLDGLPDGLREQWRWGSWDDPLLKGAYYQKEIAQAHRENRIGKVPHDPSHPVHVFFDLGIGAGDTMQIGFFQFIGQTIHVINHYQGDSQGFNHYVAQMKLYQQELKYNYGSYNLPHDIEVKEYTGRTRKETLENLLNTGIDVVPKVDIQDGINALRVVFPKIWFDQENCENLINALLNYQREWDEENQCFKPQPKKNWATHGADMMRYMAVGYHEQMKEPIDKKPSEFDRKKSPIDKELGPGNYPQQASRFHYE